MTDILGKLGYRLGTAGVSAAAIAAIAETGSSIKFQVFLNGYNTGTNDVIVGKGDQTRNGNTVTIAHGGDKCSREDILQTTDVRHRGDA